jgi:septal ring factor EnvC (AmiA/AmiB activator)
LNAAKKDIFNLQLENHFLKERLSNMAPDHIEAALKENVKIKLEILNMSKEMKKLKKILTQQDKDLADAAKERELRSGRTSARELEEMYAAEKERRKQLERAVEEQAGLREQLEDEVEHLRGVVEDGQAELEKLRDDKDRAEEEIDRMKSDLSESVGMSRGREGRLIAKLEEVSWSATHDSVSLTCRRMRRCSESWSG